MKDYSAMSDFEINKEVAYFNIGGNWLLEPSDERKFTFYNLGVQTKNTVELPDYCNNPADAWPIITTNNIGFEADTAMCCDICNELYLTGAYVASHAIDGLPVYHANPLRACMIVYLQMMEQKS